MENHEHETVHEAKEENRAKVWIQENLRIIVSIFIVAAIALGIYSYSQRTDMSNTTSDSNYLLDQNGGDEAGQSGDESQADMQEDQATPASDQEKAASPELSRETDSSFVETATTGDGTTHLARRALMNYLEKNPDSSLTSEHKVYIEDYLRKHVDHQGGLEKGESVEFSKTLITEAISHSKNLNERQLQNLKKYSSRVSAYR
jgi:hypothetical protein